MDRPINPAIRRIKIIKRTSATLLTVLCVFFCLGWLLNRFRPSVDARHILTTVVERGDVRETISASGVVIPEIEFLIPSPISSTVVKILRQPGDMHMPGDSLLVLDTRAANNELNRLSEQIRLKENQKEQIRVELDTQLNTLESDLESKLLRLELTKSRHEHELRLFELGGLSENQFKESEMDMEIAGIDVERGKRAVANAIVQTENRIDALDTEIGILEQDRSEIAGKLDQARTIVTRKGLLTWIVQDEGATISQGEVIARIADLDSYLVRATISEIHSAKLTAGMPAIIRLSDGAVFNGSIRNILPNIENGVITFMVTFDDANAARLRSNLRAEVNLVTGEKTNVLRVERGSFAQGYGINDVFVIRGDHAVRTEATFGIAGYEWFEIIDGLKAGDEVIISDMSEKLFARELVIRR